MWSRPKKSTGGRNRSRHYCSGRGNSIVEESINREKEPYPGTTEDDKSSDRYTHCIDSVGCFKKGPFQDHNSRSHPVYSGNGPFQDDGCVHSVCSGNGPFQDHGCSQPVCSGNSLFQDHGCSHTVCSGNGPFEDHGCVHPVCSGNGPFQDNGCSHPVCSDNGPLQDHHVSTGKSVCSRKDPSQGNSCSQTAGSENGPFQGHHVSTDTNVFSPPGPTNYIKLIHWNAQGAITKTSAIKTAIVQDDHDDSRHQLQTQTG